MMYIRQNIAMAIGFLILLGCAGSAPPASAPVASRSEALAPAPPSAKCGDGEFRGVGVGTGEKEALSEAQADLAKQIHSSIRVSEKYRESQNVQNGKETLGSAFVSETLVEANLQNAHDARVLSVEQRGGKVSTVVCMTKADAAKGFAERGRLVADSLDLVSHILLNTKHPKHKNETWSKTQKLWNEYVGIQKLLEGWGAEQIDSKAETFEKATDDYKSYCKNMKTHWEGTVGDCSDAMFSVLSGRLKIEKSQCRSGLKLKLSCVEKCSPSSFGGVECSFSPSLSVESCTGESYSLLKSQKPAIGKDMHSTSKAKEVLIEKLPSAEFFGEWEKELKGWMPLCVDSM